MIASNRIILTKKKLIFFSKDKIEYKVIKITKNKDEKTKAKLITTNKKNSN